jgi:hypothetical protein
MFSGEQTVADARVRLFARRQRQREQNKVDHVPGVKVSGQPQGGAIDRAQREERIRTRAHQIWEDNGRPEGCSEKFWLKAEQEVDGQQAS